MMNYIQFQIFLMPFIAFSSIYSSDMLQRSNLDYNDLKGVASKPFVIKKDKVEKKTSGNSIELLLSKEYKECINLAIGQSPVKLRVVCGNIIYQKINAIINPANEQLCPVGGLSEIIAEFTGSVVDFSDRIGKELGEDSPQCPTGFAVITSPLGFKVNGQCSLSNIIHAVGPCVLSGKKLTDENRRQLYGVHYNIFAIAEKNKIKSVAIPTISTGYFGISLEDYLPIALQAINDYFSTNKSTIEEIRIVENEEDKFNMIQKAINGILDVKKDTDVLYQYSDQSVVIPNGKPIVQEKPDNPKLKNLSDNSDNAEVSSIIDKVKRPFVAISFVVGIGIISLILYRCLLNPFTL